MQSVSEPYDVVGVTGMKRLLYAVLLLLTAFGQFSCVGEKERQSRDGLGATNVFYLPAVVERLSGEMVTVQLSKPILASQGDKLALKLAQGIIDSSYVLEGKETNLGGEQIRVERVAEGRVLARLLDNKSLLQEGGKYDFYLERKIIAIKDFEALKGNDPDIATYVQENVTTALVNSGQFNVVERYKLSSVLEEIQLSQSGIIDSRRVKKAGRLLGADLILTGTMIQMGAGWDVNLRLINTETGLIVTAINRSGKLTDFSQRVLRSTANISATFQDSTKLTGWHVGETHGERTGRGGMQKVYVDKQQGAKLSGASLGMEFILGKGSSPGYEDKKNYAAIVNGKQRDLSRYSGVEFQAKASHDLILLLVITDSDEGTGKDERWMTQLQVGRGWQSYQVPFADLSLQRKRALRKGTNQVFDLQRIEALAWSISEKYNRPGMNGTVWLDDVQFY